ncbi:MAG: CHAT domain-containing protein, partial [Anaerolineales bacterium]|nr:CHAT domain-containing protein [Anaerolineales bacterium]
AGQASVQLGQLAAAAAMAGEVLDLAESKDIPQLIYPAQELLGQLAQQQGDAAAAERHLAAAIAALERIQGRLMVEYRADYIADKDALYGQMVSLQLGLDRPDIALEYAERAKSRALLLMLSQRLDLSLSPRRPEDEGLVCQLNEARSARDNAYFQLESMYGQGSTPERLALQAELTGQERQITDLWHQLLRRHASYGRDAALWQVQVEPAQPYLAEDSALVEYFVADGTLLAFIVTRETIRVEPLAVAVAEIQSWLQRLQLNLRSVPRTRPERRELAVRNVQGILARLHELVMAPLGMLPARLMIVPHGPLHYLPFAALFDGAHYLIEQHTLSYLPGASFLKYCLEQSNGGTGALVVGHSYSERLPFTLAEATRIGDLVATAPLLEEAATVGAVQAGMAEARLIHLATHGEFRADSPLFSGLALADGWLNTLDVFNTRLRASLVTLSACQTGRNVVAGGDELLGLMRAFLSAGAASLISSHWAVDDRSTAALMATLYRQLFAGAAKADALRQAQLELIREPVEGYQHPYFWAPFYLVGDPGQLD